MTADHFFCSSGVSQKLWKAAPLVPVLKCPSKKRCEQLLGLQGDITGTIKDLGSAELLAYGEALDGIAKFIPGYTKWSRQCNGFHCSVRTPPDTTCGAAALQQMRASFCAVGAWTLLQAMHKQHHASAPCMGLASSHLCMPSSCWRGTALTWSLIHPDWSLKLTASQARGRGADEQGHLQGESTIECNVVGGSTISWKDAVTFAGSVFSGTVAAWAEAHDESSDQGV